MLRLNSVDTKQIDHQRGVMYSGDGRRTIDLIGLIYGTVIGPAPWLPPFERLIERFSFHNTTIRQNTTRTHLPNSFGRAGRVLSASDRHPPTHLNSKPPAERDSER